MNKVLINFMKDIEHFMRTVRVPVQPLATAADVGMRLR